MRKIKKIIDYIAHKNMPQSYTLKTLAKIMQNLYINLK